jgi:predicted ATPase
MSMKLRSLTVAGYRSLKSIRMEIGDVNVFVGDNGVGKSNLYRALHLAQSAAEGTFAREIAAEGGMAAVLWTGTRKKGRPVRLSIAVEIIDEDTALGWRYTIDAGLTPPMGAGFPFEPQIKEERLSIDQGRRVVDVMKRAGQGLSTAMPTGGCRSIPSGFSHPKRAWLRLADRGCMRKRRSCAIRLPGSASTTAFAATPGRP